MTRGEFGQPETRNPTLETVASTQRTFKLTLAYDGTAYAGWQFQPGRATLQGALETSLEKITGQAIRVTASGRTDAGVHALGQVVSFRCQTQLTAPILQKALNASLPRDIVVVGAEEAAENFHARTDALRKRYRYVIHDGPLPNVFERRYAWQYRSPLDAAAMARSAQPLIGTHDFRSFESSGSPRETSVRTVHELVVGRDKADEPNRIAIEVEANGFLYNMVRAIVGTLVEVGRGVQAEDWPAAALVACDRRAAGLTAPPRGLFLVRVEYEKA